MTFASELKFLKESKNLYHALELVNKYGIRSVDLNSISVYKTVDDSKRLHKILSECQTVQDFLDHLSSSDSDFSRAVSIDVSSSDSRHPAVASTVNNPRVTSGNTLTPGRYARLGSLLPCDGSVDYTRADYVEEIELILQKRTANNLIICAAPGTGKTHLVKQFAKGCTGRSRGVFSVNVSSIVAGTRHRGDLETRVEALIAMVRAEGYVLFIDEIHALANLATDGGMSVLDMLKPHLLDGAFSLIGATTPKESLLFKNDDAFMRRFTFLNLPAMTCSQLFGVYNSFVDGSGILSDPVDFEALLHDLDEILPDRNYPDKLIEFLEYYEAFAIHRKQRSQADELGNSLYKECLDRYLRFSSK